MPPSYAMLFEDDADLAEQSYRAQAGVRAVQLSGRGGDGPVRGGDRARWSHRGARKVDGRALGRYTLNKRRPSLRASGGFVNGQEPVTLGGKIAQRRRSQHLSQRQLAERILRDDATPISPQYLNDIERDRRVPPDYLLRQFAEQLGIDLEYLVFLAGRVPPSLSYLSDERAFVAFRRTGRVAPE